MKMRHGEPVSLWDSLSAAGYRSGRFLYDAQTRVAYGELVQGSTLGDRRDALRGRSVLLATRHQLATALALIELDGIARRIVLCPPDLFAGHIPSIIATAAIDTVVTDGAVAASDVAGVECFINSSSVIALTRPRERGFHQTEWILLTSGTTGAPKLVVHTLSSLAAPIKIAEPPLDYPIVWGTFYDIRRYGGLQILLRAILSRASLVLSSAEEPTGDFLTRVDACGVTHLSGTPSHWRRALMSPLARRIAPRYVRLSGEIADQMLLDHLRAVYPEAGIAHAFASTEAGVAFEVGDGLSGFPASLLGRQGAEVEMKVENGSLRIRSPRTARRYLGHEVKPLADEAGFVDTGDMIERHGDRYYFIGRRDGVINVGGRKVHPEEVEAVINSHPGVRMSLVKGRKNPVTGEIVVADVVAKDESSVLGAGRERLGREIIEACRGTLPAHKIPAAIRFVRSLAVTDSGKLARSDA